MIKIFFLSFSHWSIILSQQWCCLFLFLDMAEILSKKEVGGRNIYYIHYEDCEYNKNVLVTNNGIVNIDNCSDWNSNLQCWMFLSYMMLHLSSVNKRLDEWVSEDRMDIGRMELPRKDTKTPKKEGKAVNGTTSRPTSPDRELVVSNSPSAEFFKYWVVKAYIEF